MLAFMVHNILNTRDINKFTYVKNKKLINKKCMTLSNKIAHLKFWKVTMKLLPIPRITRKETTLLFLLWPSDHIFISLYLVLPASMLPVLVLSTCVLPACVLPGSTFLCGSAKEKEWAGKYMALQLAQSPQGVNRHVSFRYLSGSFFTLSSAP